MKCPTCNKNMEKQKHDLYVCVNKDCDDQYISVPKSFFKSIFGGH